jgi:osmotically-inducible protein OsmY
MQQSTLAERIQRELAQQAGIHIVVGEAAGAIILSGRVESGRERRRAVQIARSLAPDKRLENSLEVERDITEGIEDDELDPDVLAARRPEGQESSGYDADAALTYVPLETDEEDVVEPDNEVTADQVQPVEPEPTYFAPTDPVIGVDERGEVVVRGGWAPTSMNADVVAASAEDNQPGDEALVEAVTRELAEDASTTALRLHVKVIRGVAHLRGRVTDLSDAENAEEVAGRVPGIREVIDETDVRAM